MTLCENLRKSYVLQAAVAFGMSMSGFAIYMINSEDEKPLLRRELMQYMPADCKTPLRFEYVNMDGDIKKLDYNLGNIIDGNNFCE